MREKSTWTNAYHEDFSAAYVPNSIKEKAAPPYASVLYFPSPYFNVIVCHFRDASMSSNNATVVLWFYSAMPVEMSPVYYTGFHQWYQWWYDIVCIRF